MIELLDNGLRIECLEVPSEGVAEFVRNAPEDAREDAVVHAIEVGVFCLERASAARDLDFVRQQVEGLLRSVEVAVSSLPDQVETALVAKIGTDNGQVLAPVRGFVERASSTIQLRLKDVDGLLSGELDPARTTSTLGRALGELRGLLDPKRTDSVQGVLAGAVREVAAEGGSLSKAVKLCVDEAVKPLADQVERLGQQITGTVAAEEALRATTKKGLPYEEEIVEALQRWAARNGAEIRHVGTDNRPGDILVSIPNGIDDILRIVVEVRDRTSALGRKAITDALEAAMTERGASAGIYLSRSPEGLAKEIGDWAEGDCSRGPFVATLNGDLSIALRWLIAKHELRRVLESLPTVDRAALEAQIRRVRTALTRIGTINRGLNQIRSGAATIEAEGDALRVEIRRALAAMEEAIRSVPGATDEKVA